VNAVYTVHLAKEPFKFSCSHFTILAADRAERLHGHNYQVQVDISVDKVDPKLGFAFDFNAVKPLIRALCDELDERILLPTQSPYLKFDDDQTRVEVSFGRKRYVFPSEDTRLLPLINITSEELARHLCERLAMAMNALPHWTALRVHVEETRGQSVSFQRARG
jgi:6-pyruvoyltetrahydropterin/6-carboxytetrahydropterin synthase